jgi:hypothetical protein
MNIIGKWHLHQMGMQLELTKYHQHIGNELRHTQINKHQIQHQELLVRKEHNT